MYKFHPQWIAVKKMVEQGDIGKLKAIQASFSFFEDDPHSIVNKKEFGGGSLMDIGCYPISIRVFYSTLNQKEFHQLLNMTPN